VTKRTVPKSTMDRSARRGGARVGAGRPRRPGVDEAVFEAALGLLASRDYREISVETLAERAGVSRTTIYRRWPSKAAVVAAAVSSLYLDRVEAPDTGSLSEDLVALLSETYRVMADGEGRVLEQLVRQSGQNPELVELVRSILYARRRVAATTLNRAIARGEMTPDVDHEHLLDLLLGPLWFRLLVSGAPIAPVDAPSVIRLVLEGALPRATSPSADTAIGPEPAGRLHTIAATSIKRSDQAPP
jgi:AcrR family transcriptional regulator